jgi:hypothetical protein
MREPVEPTDCREPTVDRRRGEPAVLHPGAEQIDVRTAPCMTAMPWSVAHWKKPRRSWRYASRVRPL